MSAVNKFSHMKEKGFLSYCMHQLLLSIVHYSALSLLALGNYAKTQLIYPCLLGQSMCILLIQGTQARIITDEQHLPSAGARLHS